MWLNGLVAVVMGIFVALGAWRGALATGLGLATLVVAYLAAFTLAPGLAPLLGERLDVPALWAMPVAGTIVFFGTYVVLGIASAILKKFLGGKNAARSVRDRFVGGSFGAVRGALVSVLLVILASWVDSLRLAGIEPPLPEVGDSVVAEMTAEVVESGLTQALGDDPSARVAARFTARPAMALEELQSVVESPAIASIQNDTMFWTYIEHGNVDTALNRGSFQKLSGDEALRQRFANLGFVPAEAAGNRQVFHDAVADVMHQVSPRLRGLKNDPEVQALLQDPQVVAMVQNGDTVGLLSHPGLRALVTRVTSAPLPR
ncbi:MAG: CvpA family protein [Myxococcota bacterium]